VKEGQLEARERLIRDMEEKAKNRAELAEAEAYRLKGMLSHLEQMVRLSRPTLFCICKLCHVITVSVILH